MKKCYIRLSGGLGNQLFQYAFIRAYCLENNTQCLLDLSSLSKKGHEIYGLSHCKLSDEVTIINKYTSIRKKIVTIIIKLYYLKIFNPIFIKKINRKIIKITQPLINLIGCYYYPVGYYHFKPPKCNENYFCLAAQSEKFFYKYSNIIREELKIIDNITKENEFMLRNIKETNSVALHVRKGDYVGTNYEVCNIKYYESAIQKMKLIVKNPTFFVFSDNINWVKNNIDFSNCQVKYITESKSQYEDLKLMYNCKNFIISNSSFSWWGQYLSDYDKKIVIAPKKWLKNEQHNDIYQDNWICL